MRASSVRPRMPVVTGSASIPMKEKTPKLLNPWRGALLKALRTNIFFTPPEPLRTLTWNSPAFARSSGHIIDGLARVEALGPAARFGRDVERRLLKALSNTPMKKLKPVDWPVPPLSQAELEAEALQRLLPELESLNGTKSGHST